MINRYANFKEKIKRAYKTGGLTTVFNRGFKKISISLFKFHKSYWYARKLIEPFENIASSITVNINDNSREETLEWEKINLRTGNFCSEDYKEINIAKKNNHHFVNIKHCNEIIGFLKVGFREVYFKEYIKKMNIPHNAAFIYDTFIHQNYRGRGIAPYMINEVMKRLAKNKLEFIVCHITPTNLASQKTYAKIGFKRIRFIWHLRLFGFKIFNFSPERLMMEFSQKA